MYVSDIISLLLITTLRSRLLSTTLTDTDLQLFHIISLIK